MDSEPRMRLSEISTRWSRVTDPERFVMRYGPAIRAYLSAILRSDDVDDVEQEFLASFLDRGLSRADADRGRLRDYVKASVRNAAHTHLRRRRPPNAGSGLLAGVVDERTPEAETIWTNQWRDCVLRRAWRELEAHEQRRPGNLFHTVLRTATEFEHESSEELAVRVSRSTGRELSVDAFRKQLSRARQRFAELVVAEVTASVTDGDRDAVNAELVELGLWTYVRDDVSPR